MKSNLKTSLIVVILTTTLYLFSGCETIERGSVPKRTKIEILAPEWEIEQQMLEYTPVGSEADSVLEFVRDHLHHSNDKDIRFANLNIGPIRREDGFTEDIVFKVIQAHMGIHSSTTQDILMNGHWVYITWIFNGEDRLIEISVTKFNPSSLLAPRDEEEEYLDSDPDMDANQL